MTCTRALLAFLGALLAAPAFSQQGGDEADLAKAKQIASQVCSACHGPDGNSPAAANPSIAGQHGAYVVKQLTNFKSGERVSPIMTGMTAALTPEDIRALGAFYSQQKFNPATAKNRDLALQGQKIYRGGVASKGLPACSSCHAPTGAGIPAQYPRVAGQYADYTVAQLKAFRSGERANDPEKMMRDIAGKMTDREIQAVAEYIAGLR